MRKLLGLLAALFLAVPALVAGVPGPAQAATCPSQEGCVFANSSPSSSLTYHWLHYGVHPIYGQNGDHYVQNNQSGGAYMQALDQNQHVLWTLQDGRSYPRSAVRDLGPVYYFKLSPGPACWPRCE